MVTPILSPDNYNLSRGLQMSSIMSTHIQINHCLTPQPHSLHPDNIMSAVNLSEFFYYTNCITNAVQMCGHDSETELKE